ncbi:MAG: bifunctional metallophosphatase/5'-nucleotidase [Clostridium sp.]|nr:bifunctional metallophosphatase/5'-nucleotidase [Bacteroides sp.]MCM1199549.1 bifunctional metallophosphatase/5'-nucleotidase [Clostridium sp.]
MKRLCYILSITLLAACGGHDFPTQDTGNGSQTENNGNNQETPETPETPADELVMLFTNDLHSQIEPLDAASTYNAGKGGVARIKVLVDSVRTAEKAVILADAGDFVQGTYYFTCLDGDVEMRIQKEIGYDIRTVGNHEFDKKIAGIDRMFSQNDVITVSSNYDFSATPLSGKVQESAIIETAGLKIGFIGLGARLEGLVDPMSCEGVKYSYPWTNADKTAGKLKEQGVDLVIALSHLGYDAQSDAQYYDKGFAKNTKNIDFIIGGHSHTFLTKEVYVTNQAGQQVPIVQTGCKGIYLGYMKIDMKKTGKERFSYRLIPVNSRLDSRIDPTFAAVLKGYSTELEKTMAEVLGQCPSTMRKGTPQGLLGNWAADAMVEICENTFGEKPDMAICNNGGLRAELPAGNVTRSRIYSIFPFDNKLSLLEMKGSELLKLFDGISRYDGEPVSAGVQLNIRDGKVASVTLGDKEIELGKTYKVCTLDYLSNSDHYSLGQYISRKDSDEFVYDLICAYVRRLTSSGRKVEASFDKRIVVLQ